MNELERVIQDAASLATLALAGITIWTMTRKDDKDGD